MAAVTTSTNMKIYESFFKNSCENVEKQVSRKLRDSNTLKSNLANPYYRCLIIGNIPRLAFAHKYGRNFLPSERRGVGNDVVSPYFEIKTVDRLMESFSANVLLKVQSSGDTSLITPWVCLNTDISVKFPHEKYTTFESGKLGLPLKQEDDKLLVFFVCGGLDEDDEVPAWVQEFTPKDLGIPVIPSSYMESKGLSTITLNKKNRDWSYVVKGQGICDGDFLKIRANYYEVLGIVGDCFQPNNECVRFCQDLHKNVNNAPFSIIKAPIFTGNVAWIPKNVFESYRPFSMQITKTDVNGYAQLDIRYQNACFNKLGFLVHDTAI